MVVQLMANQPRDQRLPLIAHWGLTAGDFPAMTGAALADVDLVVVQTFSFREAQSARARAVEKAYRQLFSEEVASMQAAAGFVHAYDLTHLLALAINKAGRADRSAVRDALENLGSYAGLVKNYTKPFSQRNHDALDQGQIFLARFQKDGSLLRVRSK